jgi:hypothetical protein
MAVQEQVLRFDVPVQPLHLAVKVNESLQQLPREPKRRIAWKAPFWPETGSFEVYKEISA